MLRKLLGLRIAVLTIGILGITQIGNAADQPAPVQSCDSGVCCQKVCRPTTEMKKVTTRCYSEKCEEFCLPKASLLSCFCADCGHVRTRRDLVVKLRTHEECVNKCVVDHAPACQAGK